MDKKKLLFVDDRSKRIHAALKKYGKRYDVTIAPSVKEALRAMSNEEFSVISLDHDLNGDDFQDSNDKTSGMEIVRYVIGHDYSHHPEFIIHTKNTFAGKVMHELLRDAGYRAPLEPFSYSRIKEVTGIIAGAFDVVHPGYIAAFKEAKEHCDWLIVCLHDDPTLENPQKMKPVLSLDERTEILLSIKYVDWVLPYRTEAEFLEILKQTHPNIRFLGNDYEIGIKAITGQELNIPIHYLDRSHGWSTTKLKHLIYEQWWPNGITRETHPDAPRSDKFQLSESEWTPFKDMRITCWRCGLPRALNKDHLCENCFEKERSGDESSNRR